MADYHYEVANTLLYHSDIQVLHFALEHVATVCLQSPFHQAIPFHCC